MRYQFIPQFISTVALAGALTLSAASQADKTYSQTTTVTNSTNEQTAVVENHTTMSNGRIERKIHKAISHDPTMSNRAIFNVRIIARNGQVTLKGSVPTTMERDKIEAKAEAVVGSGNVIDHIKVKHSNYLG